MILFGGAIGWRANKQDTVTTSSTEAELLALSQTAKEAMFMSRLFKALSLELNEPLQIRCDNRQTLRLFDQSVKLVTKLRHVDIHNHWLGQECRRGTVQLQWEATRNMIADGLTKALSKQKFANFVKLLRLEDKTERLRLIQREEELQDELKAKREAVQDELKQDQEVWYRASSKEAKKLILMVHFTFLKGCVAKVPRSWRICT
jgi:hypothetical protein